MDISIKLPVDVITRGRKLREKREAKGYSQGDVAKLLEQNLGIEKFDYKRISDWENGRIKKIPKDIKDALYTILEIREDEMNYVRIPTVTDEQKQSIHVYYAAQFADFVTMYVGCHDDLSKDDEYSRDVKADLLLLFNDFLKEQDKANKIL